jgi:hypothetical protein
MSRRTVQEELLIRIQVWDTAVNDLHDNVRAQILNADWLTPQEKQTALNALVEAGESKWWAGDTSFYPAYRVCV